MNFDLFIDLSAYTSEMAEVTVKEVKYRKIQLKDLKLGESVSDVQKVCFWLKGSVFERSTAMDSSGK